MEVARRPTLKSPLPTVDGPDGQLARDGDREGLLLTMRRQGPGKEAPGINDWLLASQCGSIGRVVVRHPRQT